MGFDPGTMMAIASALSGIIGSFTGDKAKQGSSFSKEQRQGNKDLFDIINGIKGNAGDVTQQQGYQQGSQWLNDLFNDENFFNNFEAPLQRQFQENTIPELAHRFGSMGSGGSTGSTAFRNQLAREGSNLHSNIAAMRGGLQQQGVNQSLQYANQPFQNLMQLYQQAMGQPINNQYQPANPGIGSVSGPLLSGATNYWASNGGQNNMSNMNQPIQTTRLSR
jgi:surface antigen